MKKTIYRNKSGLQIIVRRSFVLFILLISFLSSFAQGDQTDINVATTAYGGTEPALLHLPDDYNSTTQNYPLILFFHGTGESGTNQLSKIYTSSQAGGPAYFIAQGKWPSSFVSPVDGKSYKFIVVSPQAPSWSTPGSAVQYIIADLEKKYRVDSTRIYVTGLSAGGQTCLDAMGNTVFGVGNKIAAGVVMSMAGNDINSHPYVIADDTIPVWGFGDPVNDIHGVIELQWEDSLFADNPSFYKSDSVNGRFTAYSGGHCCWNNFYTPTYTEKVNGTTMNIYQWMLLFAKGKVSSLPPANQPPVASVANTNISITLPVDSALLDGSSSSDPDGSISSYKWTQTSGPSSSTIQNSNSSKTAVNGLQAGTYEFQLTVTDNQGATATNNITIVVNSTVTTYRRIIMPVSGPSIWFPNMDSALNVQPGDTICIPAGDYANFSFHNLHGTAAHPVVIQNCGGVVRVGVHNTEGYTFIFDNCSYFELSGSGEPSIEYGFEMVGTPASEGGSAVQGIMLQNKTDNFDMHNVYINGVRGTGIECLTRAICSDPSTWRQNYVMENIKFHHIKMRHTGYEGFYIGRTQDYQIDNTCAVADTMFNPFIENIQIYDNQFDSTGNDAIQLALAYLGNNSIHDNKIDYPGMNGGYGQGMGILVGGETHADVYNNIINHAQNLPIQVLGAGLTRLYNNIICNSTTDGIQVGGDNIQLQPPAVYIFNNTFANIHGNGVIIWGTTTDTVNRIYNNLFVDVQNPTYNVPDSGIYIPSASTMGYQIKFDLKNNLFISNLNNAGFVNPSLYDYHLISSSPAIDYGTDLSSYGVTTDYDGNARPYGKAYDVGAFEYTGNVATNKTPVANAGGDISINLPATTATLNGSGSFDPDGTIVSYAWKLLSGPSGSQILTPNSVKSTVNFQQTGIYTYQLTVTDNVGASASDTVVVKVNPAVVVNQPPVANPGSNITLTLPTNNTTVNGSASKDPDGTIVSYSWKKISGPSQFNIQSPTTASTVINNLVAGSYVFSLTVTDNSGAANTANITITVNPAPNQPPIANAGTDQTITLPLDSAKLNGTASLDKDGTISAYNWKQVSGPASSTITSSNTAITEVTNLVAGTYVFSLTVTDNGGAKDTATMTVTVNPAANQPPVANAGSNITITAPDDSATLDGSASQDPDGNIVKYNWTKISGPGSYIFADSTQATVLVTNLTVGKYVFKLTVTDNSGASASSNVTVIVDPATDIPPVANAGSNATITLPDDSVTLDGSASSDADGTIASYNWQVISGPPAHVIEDSSAATTTIKNLTAGVYTVELTVTDNNGAKSIANITITVKAAANQPPVANAGSNITITLPINSVTVNGAASSDADGNIVSYSWKKLSGPAQFNIQSPTADSTLINNLVAGTYVFTLTVTDNGGATGTANVTITVNSAPNEPPVANAGTNANIYLPQDSLLLNGNNSQDPDGYIVSYAWKQISGPAQSNILQPDSSTTFAKNLVVGTYIFQLTVTDNAGATDSTQVSVIVSPAPNQPPVANAGNNSTINLPATIKLNGSPSYDPDGTIITYSWTQISGPVGDTIVNPSAVSTTVNNITVGTYQFKLTVTDNDGATGSDSVTIIVQPRPNTPPVANAGPNIVIVLPYNQATLNGSKSYDPDGNIVSYKWERVSGPAQYTMAGADSSVANLYNLVAGVYSFRLIVTDNNGAADTDMVNVTVQAKADIPPVANAGTDTTITLPQNSVTLDGSHSYDPDGNIVSYNWHELSGPSGYTVLNSDSAVVHISNLVVGNYVFQLTVTDDQGDTASAEVTVNVNLDNAAANGSVVLYPNPAVNSINVFFYNQENGQVNITIYDINGRAMGNYQYDKNHPSTFNQTLDISSLVPGMYILELRFNNNYNTAVKFIKAQN